MTIIHGLILGIIEGLTEFLPISSTAHLILASAWLRIPPTAFLKTFEISIQLGAILAVVVLYWRRLWSSWELIGKILAAFLPTALIGLIFYKLVKNFLLGNAYVVAGALAVGGLVLLLFERYYAEKNALLQTAAGGDLVLEKISYRQALWIGLFQALAIVPGVSRAAATIIGGLALGVKRKSIVEFSFLLAIPTMLAATVLDLYESRRALGLLPGADKFVWLLGFIAAFLTAVIAVRFFLKFIQKHDFRPFGWYRLALAAAVIAWLTIAR